MEKKFLTILKIVAVACVIILIIELIYINRLLQDKSIYFDGINSVINIDKGYVAVGSNNNNDRYFEKAKITKYNSKKEKKYERLYNKGFNGVFLDVVQDGDNLLAVGSYEADEDEYINGLRSALIVKYDNDGNMIYENDFQLLGNSKFTSVLTVEDGYIVTGQSVYDDMIVGLSEEGGALIIKYSKELEVEWIKNYGDSKTAVYNEAVIVDDYIYVVGKKDSIVGVISKYDMSGNFIEDEEYDYTDSLGFTSITSIEDRLYVGTAKKSIAVDDGNFDAMIVLYDLNLEFVKEAIYVGEGYDRYNQIIVDNNESIVAIGTTSVIDDGLSGDKVNPLVHNGLIAKYSKDLEKSSVIIYGDERDDYFTDVIEVDGNYLVSGYSSYEDSSYLSKFITYSNALKMLGVE